MHEQPFYYTYPNGDFEVENYPFFISKLKETCNDIKKKTRQYILAAFDGSFRNIIHKIKTRAVDFLDIALVSIEIFLN